MFSLKSIAFLSLFIFSINPVFAQDSDCCADLRQEVKMIQVEVKTIKKQLKTQAATVNEQQKTTKSGFESVGDLVDALHKHFPEIPGLKEIKSIFDSLNKK
jgi:hypothetical protein